MTKTRSKLRMTAGVLKRSTRGTAFAGLLTGGELMGPFSNNLMLIGVVLLVAAGVKAQTRGNSLTLTATVSEAVALSVAPNWAHGGMDVVSSGGTVRLTLSGTDANSSVIRVPLIVRSNSVFKISATVESQTAQLTQLSVLDVRATGSLVSPDAVNNLLIPQQFDLRGSAESFSSENGSSSLNNSHSFVVLTGPRVSAGGTLNSANNALQITLLIRMKPESVRDSMVHLTFAASAR